VPESELFIYVNANLKSLAMKLAVALHLSSTKDEHVKSVVREVSLHNRDPALLLSQVGLKAGLIPANIVSSASSRCGWRATLIRLIALRHSLRRGLPTRKSRNRMPEVSSDQIK
jgi:hypothetical protein